MTADAAAAPWRGVRPAEWLAWFAGLAAVSAGMISIRSHLNQAHVALAFLLIVQSGSARGGRPLGVALSVAAFLCFDVFFLPPYGTLVVRNPLDWLVLFAFLVTSLVSAQLLYRAQTEAAERIRVAREAERALALQDSYRAKDALLASVSHDLRTPLTTIKGLAHEIAQGGDDRADAIEEESDRLTRFVSQLLDLSSITSGAVKIDLQDNEAEDLLGAAAQQVAGRLDGRELRIKVTRDDPLLFGRFDFSQTLRALVNLIENAVKYSPSGEPVDLAARADGEWLAFDVADRGAGVPIAERDRIFGAFYRTPGTPPDVSGAGLGLSIARSIAESQGGSLTVRDRDGGGSVFTLRVPAVKV